MGQGRDGVALPPLEPPPSSTGKPGAVGEHCLSAQRELRSRRAAPGKQLVVRGARSSNAIYGRSFLENVGM